MKDKIRELVESVDDYHLRMAQIATLMEELRCLETEAQKIQRVDLQLWFLPDDPVRSKLLLREDVSTDVIRWIDKVYYRFGYSGGGAKDPKYGAFGVERAWIGNKVTPARSYLRTSDLYLYNNSEGRDKLQIVRSYLEQHLGRPFRSDPSHLGEFTVTIGVNPPISIG